MAFKLAIRFLESVLDKPLADCAPVPISPDEYMEIMWPLNDLFKEHIAPIQSVAYKKAFEKNADKAIEAFAFGNGGAEWAALSSGTWRVLLERHMQGIVGACMKKAANEALITHLPEYLADDHKQAALMLLLLRRMKLPYKINDQATVAWLADDAPASLTRH